MIAATALALMLSQQPLRMADSGIYNGNQAGLVERAPFACTPDDDAAACVTDDEDGNV